MAHKLINTDIITKNNKLHKRFALPSSGRIGIALYIGSKEVFIGCAINDVVEEKIIKQRYLKTEAKVNVFNID